MPNDQPQIFPAFRLVAEFADGARLTFGGITEAQAMTKMEAAQDEHGGITWYDGVTDEHYTGGQYHELIPPPPRLPLVLVDLTDADDPDYALHDPLRPEE